MIQGGAGLKEALATARDILNGDVRWDLDYPDTVLGVVRVLKKGQRWGRARSVLDRAVDEALGVSAKRAQLAVPLVQQLALTFSKDVSLPHRRHEQALEILEGKGDLGDTTNSETLGIAGGIHKRMWVVSGEMRHLTSALSYYERGMHAGGAADLGYNAINAAFLNDELARQDQSEAAKNRRYEARAIRNKLVTVDLPQFKQEKGSDWWYLVTLVEAHLGLGQHAEASTWLQRANQHRDGDWMVQATVTQLAELAQLQSDDDREGSLQVLREAFPGAELDDLGRPFGIALSGGGFRASLFHIGVLACLADAELLRRVEAISCVSGGSIIGAQYYLELKHELETKGELDPDDYRGVVRRLEEKFVRGVQRNVRTRLLTNLGESIRVLCSRRTRTRDLGDLLEKELFSHVEGATPEQLEMSNLAIQPANEAAGFHPANRNWQRRSKVPALILNATSLNTGHLWQFHATWMGEPPGTIEPEVDRRERLRRLAYDEAPPQLQHIRLGQAVAASACVPGLFEPFDLDGLYPSRRVRLVDGGVFDNQGIEGLRLAECREILVSDAGGSLIAMAKPPDGVVDAPLRVTAIQMMVVRDRRHNRLHGLKTAGALREFTWVDLVPDEQQVETVRWNTCTRPRETDRIEPRKPTDVPEHIAGLRTDLDSFSDVEAYALMAKGYEETRRGLLKSKRRVQRGKWKFLEIEPILQEEQSAHPRAHAELLRLLRAGSAPVFKVWWICRPLTVALVVVTLAGLYWVGITVGVPDARALVIIGATVLALAALSLVMRLLGLTRFLVNVGAVLAWLPMTIHLHFFDWLFLRYGRLSRLLRIREK